MGRIIKDKNFYEFWVDGKATPYKLDVNTGNLIGLRGGVIKSVPSAVDSLLNNRTAESPALVTFLYSISRAWFGKIPLNQWGENNLPILQLADRLASIGYPFAYGSDCRVLVEHHDFINKQFKTFAKDFKANTELALVDWIRNCGKIVWLTENHIAVNEHFTEEMAEWTYANRERFTAEQLPYVCYFLSRGLWEFMDSHSRLRENLVDFFDMLNYCGMTPTKDDYYRQYINTKRNYERLKEIKDKEVFAEAYAKQSKALSFENEDFMIVLPTCEKDLITEGNKQGNCVGGYGSYIKDGERLVVFVRKKSDPSTPYVTCDIITKRLAWTPAPARINQFLIHHNNHPKDEDILAFRELFQQHLIANWNKG